MTKTFGAGIAVGGVGTILVASSAQEDAGQPQSPAAGGANGEPQAPVEQ
jgi:hypothetical protein